MKHLYLSISLYVVLAFCSVRCFAQSWCSVNDSDPYKVSWYNDPAPPPHVGLTSVGVVNAALTSGTGALLSDAQPMSAGPGVGLISYASGNNVVTFYEIGNITSGSESQSISNNDYMYSSFTVAPSENTLRISTVGGNAFYIDGVYSGQYSYAVYIRDVTAGTAQVKLTDVNMTSAPAGSVTTVSRAGVPSQVNQYNLVAGHQYEVRWYFYGILANYAKTSGAGPAPQPNSVAIDNPHFYFQRTCDVTISGSVHNDHDGNGNGISNRAGVTGLDLTAVLIGADNKVIANTTVSPTDGSFVFKYVDPLESSSYTVRIITGAAPAVGSTAPAASLPDGWGNTGELNGTGTTHDGTVNGTSASFSLTGNLDNVRFGIQRLPESSVHNVMAGVNPGGTTMVTIDPAWFKTSNVSGLPNTIDYDGGMVVGIRLTSFPTNVASISINGARYGPCSGCSPWPAAGISMPYSEATGPGRVIAIDPLDMLEVSIPFAAIDIATGQDKTPGSVNLAFAQILPVLLTNFTVEQQQKAVLLKWITSNEQNNKGFIIERSVDGLSWTDIGFVPAQNANGNANTTTHYTFLDHTVTPGKNYFRLKQVDLDGTYQYSPVRVVDWLIQTNAISVYPNPVVADVAISGLKATDVLYLYDMLGRQLQCIKVTARTQTIDMVKLPPAIYTLVAKDASGKILNTYKVIKQKP